MECVIFAFVTASAFYGVVALRANGCEPFEGGTKAKKYDVTFTCEDG